MCIFISTIFPQLDQSTKTGPPSQVSESEIRTLFSSQPQHKQPFSVHRVEQGGRVSRMPCALNSQKTPCHFSNCSKNKPRRRAWFFETLLVRLHKSKCTKVSIFNEHFCDLFSLAYAVFFSQRQGSGKTKFAVPGHSND